MHQLTSCPMKCYWLIVQVHIVCESGILYKLSILHGQSSKRLNVQILYFLPRTNLPLNQY